jgi:hypothetical protein
MKRYKVLRDGISQRSGDRWENVKAGAFIELSEAAAHHFLSEKPPFVEEVGPERGTGGFVEFEPGTPVVLHSTSLKAVEEKEEEEEKADE